MTHLAGHIFGSACNRDNWFSRIDTRVKFVFAIVLLFLNLISTRDIVPLLILTLSGAIMFSLKVPFRAFVYRMIFPAVIGFFVIVTQMFLLRDGEPVFTVFNVVAYSGGLRKGIGIFFRIIGGVSLIITMSFSIPFEESMQTLKNFGLPRVFTEITTFMYRQIFVLFEEASAIMFAQRIRLGYASFSRKIKSLGVLGGMLVLRSYDRGKRIQRALSARGYRGDMYFLAPKRLTDYDFRFILVSVAIAFVLFLLK
ncbi:MAG: cobalt ECF transporter T component CbiQ [Elusimicrobiota bacterium]